MIYILLSIVLLTLTLLVTSLYSFIIENRELDLSDERFEQEWNRTFLGKWMILEEGGFVEFKPDSRLIITSPTGQIHEKSYTYQSPTINSGELLLQWGTYKSGDQDLTRYREQLVVGLMGEDLAIWDSKIVIDEQDSAESVGPDWMLKRAEATEPDVPVVPTTGRSYLAYICGDRLDKVEFSDGEKRSQYDICIANPDGSDSRKVTTAEIKATHSRVAVDGHGRVIFNCYVEGSTTYLCVTGPDGRSLGPLMLDSNYWLSYFSVNNMGEGIGICADRRSEVGKTQFQICTFNLDGSEFSVLTNDRRGRITPHDRIRLAINEAGQHAFKCFDPGDNGDDAEICGIGQNQGLNELTSDRHRPWFYVKTYTLDPLGEIIYICSENVDPGQICRIDPQTRDRESITIWSSTPYWNMADVEANNQNQIVFRCYNGKVGHQLCASRLGKPGYWNLIQSKSALSFSLPRLNDDGIVIARCSELKGGARANTGLCKLSWDGSGVVDRLDLAIPFLDVYQGRGDVFDLSL